MKRFLYTFTIGFIILLVGLYLVFLYETKQVVSQDELSSQEVIQINQILNYTEANFTDLKDPGIRKTLINKIGSQKVTILNEQGDVLFSNSETRQKVNSFEYLNEKNKAHDYIYSLTVDDHIVGTLVLNHSSQDNVVSITHKIMVYFVLSLLGFMGLYLGYIYMKIIHPFKKLQTFAKNIAKGHLDIPLKMEKTNLFGEFTWSFDLMREELKKAKEKEIQANKSKKALIAQLTHDIKTPIASIKASSEILKENIIGVNKEKYIQVISKKAEELSHLMDDLFTSTIQELNELTFHLDEYYSESLLLEMIELVKMENDQIEITTEIPNVLIKTDENRLKQVFLNIFQNSKKYAPNSKVELSFEKEENYLICTIKDFGPGVSEKDLPFVFKQFYRGENAIHHKTLGAGLGLYIAKYIMDHTEGFITCHNQNGFVVVIGLLMI